MTEQVNINETDHEDEVYRCEVLENIGDQTMKTIEEFVKERSGITTSIDQAAEWVNEFVADCELKRAATELIEAINKFREMLDEIGFELG